MAEDILWTELYRPHTVADCVLPKNIKTQFQDFVDQKKIPNLLLYGSAGTGKTTIARAMCDELGVDYIVINASLERNIDTLRNRVSTFASTLSLRNNKRKIVILDEADYLNPNSFQPALRGFMEEYSKVTGFILTCNFKNRIIEPLHSRCINVDFSYTNADNNKLMQDFMQHVIGILKKENVKFDMQILANVIKKYYPDFRRILNELQGYATGGEIDTGILGALGDVRIEELIPLLKEKEFSAMLQWVANNTDMDSVMLYRKLYDNMRDFLEPASCYPLVLILGEAQYKDAFVADREINTAATLTRCMAELVFK